MIRGVPETRLAGRAVVLLTGGKDSATCFEIACNYHSEVIPVYFNFGTKQSNRNMQYAAQYAYDGDYSDGAKVFDLEVIDMSDLFFGRLSNPEVSRQSEFGETFNHPDVEDGDLDYIPMRTVGMLAKASIIADRLDAGFIYFGFNDDEPLKDVDESDVGLELGEKFIRECSLPSHNPTVVNPLSGADSEQVIRLGELYGVEWELTCSCCEPGPGHCGECSSCVDRAKGFAGVGIDDPAE